MERSRLVDKDKGEEEGWREAGWWIKIKQEGRLSEDGSERGIRTRLDTNLTFFKEMSFFICVLYQVPSKYGAQHTVSTDRWVTNPIGFPSICGEVREWR